MPATQPHDSRTQRYLEEALVPLAARASGNTAAVDGFGTTKSIRAGLNVTAVSGTNPTLNVTLEDTVDGTNWNTIGTFTQKTGAAYQVINVTDLYADRVRAKWVVGGTAAAATLSTNLTGDNNDLVFTSVGTTTAANDITVEYVDPGENDASLSVEVDGNAITVNLATDSGGAITTTGDTLKTAYDLVSEATALATVADKAANDGSGVVTEMAATHLAGGGPASATFSVIIATEIDPR